MAFVTWRWGQAIEAGLATGRRTAPILGPLVEDADYKLITASNDVIRAIDDDTANIYSFIADIYCKKFPGLTQLVRVRGAALEDVNVHGPCARRAHRHVPGSRAQVPNAVQFARTVKTIGNALDLTELNLSDVLPAAQAMVVTVAGSTSNQKPLPAQELARAVEGCDEALALDAAKRRILE